MQLLCISLCALQILLAVFIYQLEKRVWFTIDLTYLAARDTLNLPLAVMAILRATRFCTIHHPIITIRCHNSDRRVQNDRHCIKHNPKHRYMFTLRACHKYSTLSGVAFTISIELWVSLDSVLLQRTWPMFGILKRFVGEYTAHPSL